MKVLLADRQELITAGIRRTLEPVASCEVTGVVSSRAMLRESLQQALPDVLVLDYINLFDFTAEHCAQLQQQYPTLKLLVLTADTDPERMLRVLQRGVLAFLTKNCSRREVITALEAVREGKKFYCTAVLELLTQSRSDASPLLTARELRIVRLIAQDVSTEGIAEQLHLSPHTIHAHRKRILKKLGAKSPVGLVMQALRQRLIRIE